MTDIELVRCYGPCKKEKPREDYSKHSGRRNGLQPWCDECRHSHERKFRYERESAQDEMTRYYTRLIAAWPAPRAFS